MRAMLLVFALLLGLVPVRLPAGTRPADLVRFEGSLQDAFGNGIEGAAATLRAVKPGQELAHFQSREGGRFAFWYTPAVVPGPYELHFEASGFEPRTVAWPPADLNVILRASKAGQK